MHAHIDPLPIDADTLRALHATSLGGDGTVMEPACALALQANFGSVERWREAFAAMGHAHAGGPGWVVLTFNVREGSLGNVWLSDPTLAAADALPILAMDMARPAHHGDSRAYVDAFMANINWAAVYARYQHAVHAASEPLAVASIEGATLLDVRRAGVFDKASTMIPGAAWKDPADVAQWAQALPRDRDVVVYCVYGHEVGRATAMRLRAAGLKARFLEGGIDAWQAAGQSLTDKGNGS